MSIENKGQKYIIDLKNQAVTEEATSFDSSNSDFEEEWIEKHDMGSIKMNDEGILEL